MKKVLKDTYKFIIFGIVQAIYFDLEYIHDERSIKIIVSVILTSFVLTFILLIFKLIFETFIVKISSIIFKESISIRFILKTFINSMVIPTIICVCFMIFQIVSKVIFKVQVSEYFQIISLTIVGVIFLICSMYSFYKSKYCIAVYSLFVYTLIYIGFQMYNLFLAV